MLVEILIFFFLGETNFQKDFLKNNILDDKILEAELVMLQIQHKGCTHVCL